MHKLVLAAAVTGAVVSSALASQANHGLAARSLGFSLSPRMMGTGKDSSGPRELELVQAQVIFRHGARSPFTDTPDAPNIWAANLRANAAHLPSSIQLIDYRTGANLPLSHAMGGSAGTADRSLSEEKSLGGGLKSGMLTEPGLEQARMLGKQLHDTYVQTGFVTSPHDVLLRSSLTARTVETLFGCISSLFPGLCDTDSPSHIFPVVVGKKGVGSEHTDWINVSVDSCARLTELFREGMRQWNGIQMPAHVATFVATHVATSGERGLQVNGDRDAEKYGIMAWRDWVSCRLGSGLPLYNGVTMKEFAEMDVFAGQQAASWFMGGLERAATDRTETLRLAHGRTMQEVLGHLCAASRGAPDMKKLVLYSAHDWTVMPILLMLSDPSSPYTPWPRFCSQVRIELLREREGGRDESRGYYVRAFYHPGTHGKDLTWGAAERVCIMGEDGGELVELSKFCKLIAPFIPTDYDVECKCT
jgi:hypothetical protein